MSDLANFCPNRSPGHAHSSIRPFLIQDTTTSHQLLPKLLSPKPTHIKKAQCLRNALPFSVGGTTLAIGDSSAPVYPVRRRMALCIHLLMNNIVRKIVLSSTACTNNPFSNFKWRISVYYFEKILLYSAPFVIVDGIENGCVTNSH